MILAVVAAITTTALTACSDEKRSVAAAPTSSSTANVRPSSMLSPDGFGAKTPSREQIAELREWFAGPGAGAKRATADAGRGVDKMTAAEGVRATVNACTSVTDPLTIRLPAALPTPDPDLTNALTTLVDDGKTLAAACAALGGAHPTDADVDAVMSASSQLGDDFQTAGNIINRDGDLVAAHR
ncbi:hypothetical protein A7R75_30925 [Mycolicibacterium llatzerense]|nr:hypothetical protein [Mycolicibacterium llatzerense]